jgi:hypothetical protein
VYNYYNVGVMASRGLTANRNPGNPGFNNSFEIVTTPGHMASGKAFRIWQGKNNYGAPGDLDYGSFVIPCNGAGVGTDPAGAYKQKLYFQAVVWVDSIIDYYWQLAGYGDGLKFWIIDGIDTTATHGEFVITNYHNTGFITAYRDTPSSNSILKSISTPANGSNYLLNNAINNGTALSDQNSYERRYGPMVYGMTGGTSQGSRLSTQGCPDPEAAAATVVWNRAGLTVVECECDLANDRMRFWAAHYGDPPKLLGDTNLDNTLSSPAVNFKANAGPRVGTYGTGWSGVTLTNLIYSASGALNPGYPTDAYIDYSELIFHGSPIPFPGGHALPT